MVYNIFMAKPKTEIINDSYEKIIDDMYYYLASLPKPEMVSFLEGVFTESEIRMMHRRWHIAILLSAGLEYRAVASIANVSTGTVMSVKKLMLSDKESVSKAIKHFKDVKKDEVLADNRTIA